MSVFVEIILDDDNFGITYTMGIAPIRKKDGLRQNLHKPK